MKRAVDVVTIVVLLVVGVWLVATNASDGKEVALYSLVVLAAIGLIVGRWVAVER